MTNDRWGSEEAAGPEPYARSSVRQMPLFVVEPAGHGISLSLRELWGYRELLYFLAWRDVKVRYKQTWLGVAWAILQPFLMMVVFTVVFGNLGQIPSDNMAYPIFAFAALLPWQLFSNSFAAATNSLVLNQHLITKIYFPRLLIPLAAVFVGLVDATVAFFMLVALMVYFGIVPAVTVLTLPLFVLLAVAVAFAAGLWLSALNVRYRDVQQTMGFLTQFWLFATPVAYPSSMIPESWRLLYGLNPMVGVIEGFRWALFGQARSADSSTALMVAMSVAVTSILLAGGLMYFKSVERTFADII